jgi:transcriptional repressor NrdR
LNCPFCSKIETRVLESRIINDSVRRRRECNNCTNRFTTYEKAMFHLKIIKKDGREQEFDLKKVERSVERACGKIDSEIIEQLTRKIEQRILKKKLNTIKSADVGKVVLQELKKFDKIAYFRYAMVYKSLNNPELLKKELNTIITR